MLVTYYGNVIVLLSNLFLALAVFSSNYTVSLICVGFIVLMLTILQVALLWQYEAIEVARNTLRRVPPCALTYWRAVARSCSIFTPSAISASVIT